MAARRGRRLAVTSPVSTGLPSPRNAKSPVAVTSRAFVPPWMRRLPAALSLSDQTLPAAGGTLGKLWYWTRLPNLAGKLYPAGIAGVKLSLLDYVTRILHSAAPRRCPR